MGSDHSGEIKSLRANIEAQKAQFDADVNMNN